MTLTARDRKIVGFIVVGALFAAYWFLLLSPKRAEQAKVTNALTAAQTAQSTAAQRLAELSAAKRSFAGDFETVIRLGKSIPASLDMPSLLVQLNTAAAASGIDFTSIQTGQRATAPGTAAPAGAAASTPASSTGAKPATAAASSSGIPGLDSIPLTFQFDGDFFRLASFFHSVKRFVQVVNNQIAVRGRLMTIDSFSFKSPQASGNNNSSALTATIQATVYLAPKAQGLAAGATPGGPAGSTAPAPTNTATASTSAAPAAAVTP